MCANDTHLQLICKLNWDRTILLETFNALRLTKVTLWCVIFAVLQYHAYKKK